MADASQSARWSTILCDAQDQLDARMEEDAEAGVPPDPSAAAAFNAAKAWVLPRVGDGFRLLAGTVLPPELLTAVMVGAC